MGNTPSTNNDNNPSGSQVTTEKPKQSSGISQEEQTKPVATGQPIKSSFHDFGSNSPFVGSPLLSHEEYKKIDGIEDIIYGNSQEGSLASSFNESEILDRLNSQRSSIVTVEPSYKNTNKIIHDFGSIGGIAPMTSVNAQGLFSLGRIRHPFWTLVTKTCLDFPHSFFNSFYFFSLSILL
jgi:hypothetical protein